MPLITHNPPLEASHQHPRRTPYNHPKTRTSNRRSIKPAKLFQTWIMYSRHVKIPGLKLNPSYIHLNGSLNTHPAFCPLRIRPVSPVLLLPQPGLLLLHEQSSSLSNLLTPLPSLLLSGFLYRYLLHHRRFRPPGLHSEQSFNHHPYRSMHKPILVLSRKMESLLSLVLSFFWGGDIAFSFFCMSVIPTRLSYAQQNTHTHTQNNTLTSIARGEQHIKHDY